MKKSPTLLMKELKLIKSKIDKVHEDDAENSTVPARKTFSSQLEPDYDSGYSYDNNRKLVKELQKREMDIHMALNRFNANTKVDGYDMTMSEALVRLGQIRSELKAVSPLADMPECPKDKRPYVVDGIRVRCFDGDKAKEDLEALQIELANLQVAVDKTNLNSVIDC